MIKLATLTGHTLQVLYVAVSPDGQTIVTGAGQLSHPKLSPLLIFVDQAGGIHMCH